MTSSPELQLPHAVEERLKNHKVVTIPSQGRGRLTVRDVVGAHNNIKSTSTGSGSGHRNSSNRNSSSSNRHHHHSSRGSSKGRSEGSQQPYQPQRPRSLSAGRTRNSHRSGDLVQDIYDRMGVNLKKGQGIGGDGDGGGDNYYNHNNQNAVTLAAVGSNTHSCTPLENVNDSSSHWARLRSNVVSGSGGDCSSTRSAGAVSSPGGLGLNEDEYGMKFSGRYRPGAAAISTATTSATTSTSTTSSAATTSRGRGREKSSPVTSIGNTGSGMSTAIAAASSSSSGPIVVEEEQRRARSLSRGRSSTLAQRWPPPGLMSGISKAVEEAMAAKNNSTHNNQHTTAASVAAQTTTAQPISKSANNSPKRINHQSNSNSININTVGGGVGALGTVTSSPSRRNKPVLTTARSMDTPTSSPLSLADPNNNHIGEEKKDEERNASEPIVSVSIKDRISVYGNKVGDVKNSKSKKSKKTNPAVRPNITRKNVDPEYIAQFSSRELPPKIDIYAESSSKAMQDEKKEADLEDDHDNNIHDHHDDHDDHQHSPATVTSSQVEGDKNAVNTQASHHQRHPSAGRKSGLANAFLAAIQSPPVIPANNATAANIATVAGVTGVPVSEIAVTDNGDDMIGQGNSNDTNSATGLSTMSGGEEFSHHSLHNNNHKQQSSSSSLNQQPIRRHSSWHQQDQRNRVSTYTTAATTTTTTSTTALQQQPSPHQRSNSGSAAVGNHNHNQQHSGGIQQSQPQQQQPQPQIFMDAIQKMVEERVQAQVLELEARIETKLRRLVKQMEEKVMQRLDALEDKITAVNSSLRSVTSASQEI